VLPPPAANGEEMKVVSLGIFAPLLIFLLGHLDHADNKQDAFQDPTHHLKRR